MYHKEPYGLDGAIGMMGIVASCIVTGYLIVKGVVAFGNWFWGLW